MQKYFLVYPLSHMSGSWRGGGGDQDGMDVGQILIRMLIGNLQWKSMTKNLFTVKKGH